VTSFDSWNGYLRGLAELAKVPKELDSALNKAKQVAAERRELVEQQSQANYQRFDESRKKLLGQSEAIIAELESLSSIRRPAAQARPGSSEELASATTALQAAMVSSSRVISSIKALRAAEQNELNQAARKALLERTKRLSETQEIESPEPKKPFYPRLIALLIGGILATVVLAFILLS
jgi:hypothetical protein